MRKDCKTSPTWRKKYQTIKVTQGARITAQTHMGSFYFCGYTISNPSSCRFIFPIAKLSCLTAEPISKSGIAASTPNCHFNLARPGILMSTLNLSLLSKGLNTFRARFITVFLTNSRIRSKEGRILLIEKAHFLNGILTVFFSQTPFKSGPILSSKPCVS